MAMAPTRSGASAPRSVNLCLQGGGAHGAFTWGALDRLLEDPSIEVKGISGTSAGAVNAVVLADGLRRGGNAGGRAALGQFWRRLGALPGLASLSNPVVRRLRGEWHLDGSPVYLMFDLLGRLLSPYAINPTNYNPLRDLVADSVDFAALRDADAPRVLVCATTVSTGQRRVFDNTELSVDAVLASTCLPSLFPAVEIDGEALWDGGYTGNPALYPLYLRTGVDDFLVIRINPLHRAAVPQSARDIINRVNEISFNATFLLELRAFGLVQEILRAEGLTSHRVARLRFHAIDADADLATLGASSKLNNEPEFLTHLFELGRRTADAWLERHRDDIGERATFAIAPTDTAPPLATNPAAAE
jgi:NTE family protein